MYKAIILEIEQSMTVGELYRRILQIPFNGDIIPGEEQSGIEIVLELLDSFFDFALECGWTFRE